MPHIQVSQGTIDYRDRGDGPAIVFIHGMLVDGHVWDPVVAALSGRARCIIPELPLGSLSDRGVRRDLIRVLRGISPEHTLAAAERLRTFDRPVLIAWGLRDRFFPVSDAERLEALLPYASLERIENARTFVQLDAPDRLAELVGEMLPAGAPAVQ